MFRHLLAAAAIVAVPVMADASAIISDGNVSLGVDDFGQLNPTSLTGTRDVAGERIVGVRWVDTALGDEYESTSHGCYCEGWGLALDGAIVGSANNDDGVFGLASDSFTSTSTTATSVVRLTGSDEVYVTHEFKLSDKTDDLYEVSVTVENRGATDYASMEYRRVMDWDTSPTPFREFVTIKGTGTTTLLSTSTADGFVNANPLSTPSNRTSCGVKVDFTACGPADHGAVFDFDLGALAAGESYEFDIFYGGALGLAAADAALGAVGAELASFGWSGDDVNQDGVIDAGRSRAGAIAPTFIFAFAGVGGSVIVPPPPNAEIPLPAGGWLMLGGIGALAAVRRRRKKAA